MADENFYKCYKRFFKGRLLSSRLGYISYIRLIVKEKKGVKYAYS